MVLNVYTYIAAAPRRVRSKLSTVVPLRTSGALWDAKHGGADACLKAASVHLGVNPVSQSSSLEVTIHPPHTPVCTLTLNVPVDKKKPFSSSSASAGG